MGIMLNSYANFCLKSRRRLELMDAQMIGKAGGVDAVLKDTWANLPPRDKRKFVAHVRYLATVATAVQLPKFDDEEAVQFPKSDESFVSEVVYLDNLPVFLPYRASQNQLQQMTAEIMAEQTGAEAQQVQQSEYERVYAA